MKPLSQPAAAKPEMPKCATGQPCQLKSAELFGARDEILIAHGDDTYRLRRTRQDKLILTK